MLRGPCELEACVFTGLDGYFSEHWLRQIYWVPLQKNIFGFQLDFLNLFNTPHLSVLQEISCKLQGTLPKNPQAVEMLVCATLKKACFMRFHNTSWYIGRISQSHSSLDYWGVQGPNDEPLPANCLLFFLSLSALNQLNWKQLETEKSLREELSLEVMEPIAGAISALSTDPTLGSSQEANLL